MRPAHTPSINVVRAGALFVSDVQQSDVPSARQVQEAVARAVREFGSRGCADRVAQEFGDHPEIAAARMRWALHATGAAFAGPHRDSRAQQRSGHRFTTRAVCAA
jgi:hypothetical protein